MQPFKSIIAILVDKNCLLFNMTLAIVDNNMDLHVQLSTTVETIFLWQWRWKYDYR